MKMALDIPMPRGAKSPPVTVSVPMPPELRARIQAAAAADGRTMADWMRLTLEVAMEAALARHKED